MKSLYIVAVLFGIMLSNFAYANNCPDLQPYAHPDPLQDGWVISPWSASKDPSGSHSFAQVQISNYQVARQNTVSCHYDNGNLIIYKLGQFNHPDDPSLWFHTYEYDKCSRAVTACIYYSF